VKAGHAEDPVRGIQLVCAATLGNIDIAATMGSSVVIACGICRLFLLLRRRRGMVSVDLVGADGARAVIRYAR